MKKIYVSILFICVSILGFSQTPVMVKDIIAGSNSGFKYSSTYNYFNHNFSVVWEKNGVIYFTACDYSTVPNGNTPTNNIELWRSDGTDIGTSRVKDINPGNNPSYPSDFVEINGELYFTADDGTNGRELWKTDGTNAGTVIVKDIKPGAVGGFEYASTYNYYTTNFSVVWQNGNEFYFVAVDYSSVPNGSTPVNNYELWKSDGTAAGTVRVANINPGNNPSYPGDFVAINGVLYFSASDGTNGRELWKTDGTTAGTVMVKDIKPGTVGGFEYCTGTSYYTSSFSVVWRNGNDFYFVAIDYSSLPNGSTPVNNYELWKSDGTTAGTVRVANINPGNDPSYPNDFNDINGVLYFAATDATHGRELWKTDGTTSGTVMVKEIKSGAVGGFEYCTGTSYYSSTFSVVWRNGNDFYFVAIDYSSLPNGSTPINNYELWKSDGTTAGTVRVADINPGNNPSYPNDFNEVNGVLYFAATDVTYGRELWKTDGTTAGTVMVKEIKSGAVGGFEYNSGTSYYSSTFSVVWRNGNNFYFVAIDYSSVPNGNTPINNYELWKSDGTTSGTVRLADIYAGNDPSYPSDFKEINGVLYFTANNGTNGRELWKTDGTTVGTTMVKDIRTGTIGGFDYASTYNYYTFAFYSPFNDGNYFYFVANDNSSVPNGNAPTNNYEIWKSDGTNSGTSKVMDIHPSSAEGSYPGEFYVALGNVFFTAENPISGRELWKIAGITSDINELSSSNDFLLYPNPANNSITILAGNTNSNKQVNSYSILDLNGRVILSERMDDSYTTFKKVIDVSSLTAGMYLIQLSGNGISNTLKFVKE